MLSAISIITLDDYSEYKLAEGIKPVSMATILRHLRRFFNFCTSRNYMQPLSIEMPRVEQEIKEPYTTEEMKNLGLTDSQINSLKRISIYDELILNPDLSKIE